MPPSERYRAAPRFDALAEGFWDVVEAADFPRRTLRFRNDPWAERVGLGALDDAEWEAHLARFEPLEGNLASPLALRYHGHQFMSYNPGLGDGRGFLFAQLRDPVDGRLLDLGTKGSGETPWSRGGDGRLTLKGGVREVLATEMLEALGVYTSKTFSLFETGEELYRGDEPSPTRSSVLVRLSHGHVRFGSFQRHAHLNHPERLQQLLDFALEHYLPGVASAGNGGGGGEGDTPAAFVREVARRSAELCASWMAAGFVHGVLNTDNMNVTGESFDYGPYRFLPVLDPRFTAAYFDHGGLYAYGRQPTAVAWNLEQLARALQALSPSSAFAEALAPYAEEYSAAYVRRFLERLGLEARGPERDRALVEAAHAFLAESRVGFPHFFHDWYGGEASRYRALIGPSARSYTGPSFDALRSAWEGHAPAWPGRLEDPCLDRPEPCAMLIDEIEAIWDAIDQDDDWGPFERKVEDVRALARLSGRGAHAGAGEP